MYPKTLYLVVNTPEEETKAREYGLKAENERIYQEYPKMLYLHPEDKTKEQTQIVVANEDEEKAAAAKSYQVKPHLPVLAPETGAVAAVPVFIVQPPVKVPVAAPVAEPVKA